MAYSRVVTPTRGYLQLLVTFSMEEWMQMRLRDHLGGLSLGLPEEVIAWLDNLHEDSRVEVLMAMYAATQERLYEFVANARGRTADAFSTDTEYSVAEQTYTVSVVVRTSPIARRIAHATTTGPTTRAFTRVFSERDITQTLARRRDGMLPPVDASPELSSLVRNLPDSDRYHVHLLLLQMSREELSELNSLVNEHSSIEIHWQQEQMIDTVRAMLVVHNPQVQTVAPSTVAASRDAVAPQRSGQFARLSRFFDVNIPYALITDTLAPLVQEYESGSEIHSAYGRRYQVPATAPAITMNGVRIPRPMVDMLVTASSHASSLAALPRGVLNLIGAISRVTDSGKAEVSVMLRNISEYTYWAIDLHPIGLATRVYLYGSNNMDYLSESGMVPINFTRPGGGDTTPTVSSQEPQIATKSKRRIVLTRKTEEHENVPHQYDQEHQNPVRQRTARRPRRVGR